MSPPVDKVPSDDKLPAAADVVVIGGGIIGVSALYALAKKGHRVALVEKGVIAGEQSSRNWGWCRQQNRDPREIPLIKHSLAMWGGLGEEVGTDLGFRRTGLVYATTDPADLAQWERWGEHARQHQVVSRMLSAAEVKAMTPGSAHPWIGGVSSPTDGRAEPAKAAPAIAAAARRLGASIHQNCAARGLETEGGAISAVVTEQGAIRTRAVLLAGGAWTSMFCRRHGIDLPQASVRATVFRTEAAPEVISGGLWTTAFSMRRRLDGGYTVAQSGRGRLEITPQGLRYARNFWPTFKARRKNLRLGIGGSFFAGPEALASWSLDGESPFERIRVLDPPAVPALVRSAFDGLAAAYPALAGIRIADSWGGYIDSMPDEIPVISPVDGHDGVFVATGFSGHGFGIGPAAGRLAADIVAGDPPIVDPTPFRYSRLVDGTPLGPSGLI